MTFDHVRTPLVWPRKTTLLHAQGAWRSSAYWLDHWYTGTKQPAGGSPFAPNGIIAHQTVGFPKARHYGIALGYHRAAEVANWIDPQGDFTAALQSGDDVALDRVFQRAHLLHRWDLLPDWYTLTWYTRLTCTPRLQSTPLELKKSVSTGTGVYPYWQYPAPAQVERWKAGLWWASGGDVGLGLGGAGCKWIDDLVDVPSTALEAEWSSNGLTPERLEQIADFSHTWQPYASNELIQQEVSFEQAKDHLWTPAAASEVFQLVGFPTFPGIAKLQQLAAEATATMQTPAWQAKALAWHKNFEKWCAQFGLPNPPPWYGLHVAYRPFWWRLDVADVLAGNVNPWADAFNVDPFDFDYEAKKAEDWATTDFWEIAGQIFAFTVGTIVLGGFVGAAFGAIGVGGAGGLGAAAEGGVGAALQGGLGSEISGGTFADGVGGALEQLGGEVIGDVIEGAAGALGVDEGIGQLAGDVAGGAADGDLDMNDWLNALEQNVNPLLGAVGGAIDAINGIAGGFTGSSTPGINGNFGAPSVNLTPTDSVAGGSQSSQLLLVLGAVAAVAFWK
jgi:hypothetical protein